MPNLIASLAFMLRVALIPRGVISHAEDKPSCIQSERYPTHGGLAEKQRLAQALFGIQEPFTLSLACKSVVSRSIKPCLHTQLPEHNKSYRLVYLNGNNAAEGENNIKYANSYPMN